jgi:ribosome-associated translation inhibitor RaiA
MQIQFVFRKPAKDQVFPQRHQGMHRGDLEAWVTEELEASLALLGKKGRCQVFFSLLGKSCRVEVKVMSGWGYFQASQEATDFLSAIRLIGEKLDRQVTRAKEKLSHHHNPARAPLERFKELAQFSSDLRQKAI